MDSDETKLLDTENFYQHLYFFNENKLHNLLFTDSKFDDNQSISYLYSSLYCLTNNNFLMNHFLSLNSEDNGVKPFYDMIISIYNDIKSEKVSKSNEAIKYYEKSISSYVQKDPRILIRNILIKTLQIPNIEKNSSISQNLFSKDGDSQDFSKALIEAQNQVDFSLSSSFITQSFIWLDEQGKDEIDGTYSTNIDVVIKVLTNIDKNDKTKIKIQYGYSNFIPIYLPKDESKEFTIPICLRNYLNKLKEEEQNTSKVFYRLPETLIILIFFGLKDEDNLENCKYNFDEILDFNQPEYKDLFDSEIKFKKYFLSSLIVCKFPKNYKQFFYSFCRKEKDSKYILYNCKESKVRQNQDVKNKLHKKEVTKLGDITSYPFVLVYSTFKD